MIPIFESLLRGCVSVVRRQDSQDHRTLKHSFGAHQLLRDDRSLIGKEPPTADALFFFTPLHGWLRARQLYMIVATTEYSMNKLCLRQLANHAQMDCQ